MSLFAKGYGLLTETRGRLVPGEKISGPISWLMGRATSAAGVNVTADSALTSAAAGACVELMCTTMGILPCLLYARGEGDSRERARTENLYWLLQNEPNPEMNAFEFKRSMTAMMILRGTAFAYQQKDPFENLMALWPIQPGRCWPERVKGQVVYKLTLSDGSQAILLPREVLRISGFAEFGLMGRSKIDMHRDTIGTEMATRDYRARWYKNDGTPGSKMTLPTGYRFGGTTMDEVLAEKKKIADDLKQQFQGDNQHKVFITEAGGDFQALGSTPRDSMMKDGMTFQLQDVARAMGVPSTLIGDPNGMKYDNVEGLAIQFVKFGLASIYGAWEGALNQQVIPELRKRELFFEFMLDALMRGDLASRVEAISKAIQCGNMTVNEGRAMENRNPLPGGDVSFVPLAMRAVGPDAGLYEAAGSGDRVPGSGSETDSDALAARASRPRDGGNRAAGPDGPAASCLEGKTDDNEPELIIRRAKMSASNNGNGRHAHV